MIAAYENDAELAMSSLDFTAATREMIEILTIGVLTRATRSGDLGDA
jgi:hypothetical protein